ncbi:LLM class flavin-dependent oxidoreductase [Microbacterium caowuchunii]|uniref:LLM class flavin-dependent oxidoreductase n=1 Tax=Microbacterium caowuchunii TaxID=2614638 RepID=A0A5N0TFT7_9MICO|nr:LLM class flavin-dependent oxidoreductase [Microbacterium caowuchunii]KAA9132129.1 LLM class flavin-dependent oxidoreductase [Microbacterium caowuchunii]
MTADVRGGMEFGVFDWVDAAPGETVAETYAARIRLVRAAEDLGFSRYHVAEHHGTPLGLAPSPGLFLAAVARETARIRLAATTFILPLYDPLRLAEEIGMVDQLSGGRLEIGIGKGSSPIEAAMFGLDGPGTLERYEAVLEAVLEALATGVYRRADGEPVPLFVRPVQEPLPPIWYPTSNPVSIRQVAEQGRHTIFGFGFVSPPLEDIRVHSRTFFGIRAQAGGAGDHSRFGILRHVFVAEDDGRARAVAREALATHYESFSHLWRQAGDPRYGATPDLDDLIDRHLIFVGSAASVADQVAHAVRTAEVNYLAGAFAWGSLSEEQSRRSLELFADVVMPAARAAFAEISPG